MTDFHSVASSKLCQQFGLDSESRNQRMKLLELTDDDLALAITLVQTIIKPHIDEIVNQFYEKLMQDPTAYQFIGDPEMLRRLKKIQKNYLLNLGIDFDTESYFESRLRAGLAHAWVGLPLMTYQCGYHIQQKIIAQHIKDFATNNCADVLIDFLAKIIALDMSLAIETYHSLKIQGLAQSLDNMQDKHRQLQKRANKDSLTGVLIRAQIFEKLKQLVHSEKTQPHNLSIMMVDIDHFKKINDEYGHQTGDLVLKQVVNRIKAAMRSVDLIGRYGGEEFLILLPKAALSAATKIAERIVSHVCSTPIKSNEILLDVSVSIGITEYAENDDGKHLIARADKALYQAKNSGRNQVVSLDVGASLV